MEVEKKIAQDRRLLDATGIIFAATGVVALIGAFGKALRGMDLVDSGANAAIGMGFLGGALAFLGEAPTAPTPRRVYRAVRIVIPVSVLLIASWQALR